MSLFYDEQVPLGERRRLFQDLVSLLARIKTGSALLLLQPLLPRAASNRHFGRLLAPVMDYFVEVEAPRAGPSASPPATPAVSGRPPGTLGGGPHHAAPSRPPERRTLKWTYYYPNAPDLHPGLKFTARLRHWSQTLDFPEDAMTYLLEILKFLGTLGLILVTALIMLMAG